MLTASGRLLKASNTFGRKKTLHSVQMGLTCHFDFQTVSRWHFHVGNAPDPQWFPFSLQWCSYLIQVRSPIIVVPFLVIHLIFWVSSSSQVHLCGCSKYRLPILSKKLSVIYTWVITWVGIAVQWFGSLHGSCTHVKYCIHCEGTNSSTAVPDRVSTWKDNL